MVYWLQDMLVQCRQKACKNTQPISDFIEGLLQEMKSIPNTAWLTKNMTLDNPRIYVKYYYSLKSKTEKNIAIEWLQMTLCYTHRSVPSLAIIREASFCCRWEQIQRPMAYIVQRMIDHEILSPKFDTTIKSLSSGLKEPCGKESGMSHWS